VSPASPAGVVMKFGGTSVADADAMTRVVNIVRSQRESQAHATPPVVVVSALSKVTDGLIRTAHFADEGDAANASALVSELRDRHIGIASTLTSGARTAQLVEALRAQFRELGDLVAAQRRPVAHHEAALDHLGQNRCSGLADRAASTLKCDVLDLITGIIDLEIDRYDITTAGIAARHRHISWIQRAVVTRILIMIE